MQAVLLSSRPSASLDCQQNGRIVTRVRGKLELGQQQPTNLAAESYRSPLRVIADGSTGGKGSIWSRLGPSNPGHPGVLSLLLTVQTGRHVCGALPFFLTKP